MTRYTPLPGSTERRAGGRPGAGVGASDAPAADGAGSRQRGAPLAAGAGRGAGLPFPQARAACPGRSWAASFPSARLPLACARRGGGGGVVGGVGLGGFPAPLADPKRGARLRGRGAAPPISIKRRAQTTPEDRATLQRAPRKKRGGFAPARPPPPGACSVGGKDAPTQDQGEGERERKSAGRRTAARRALNAGGQRRTGRAPRGLAAGHDGHGRAGGSVAGVGLSRWSGRRYGTTECGATRQRRRPASAGHLRAGSEARARGDASAAPARVSGPPPRGVGLPGVSRGRLQI